MSAPSDAPIPANLLPDSAAVGPNGELTIGGCSTLELAERFGTPLFVYDTEHLRSRCRAAIAAFGAGRVVYATKAFLCTAIARLVTAEGLDLDVASGGELHVALAAGVAPERCTLHGNNKSESELRHALDVGVGRIVVDSFNEIDRLERLLAEGDSAAAPPRVLVRITPGVHAHTHEYVSTGQDDSKFGFNAANGDAATAIERLDASPAIDLVGIHGHVGSNVFDTDSFALATEVIARFATDYSLPELVVGGGLGVAYVTGETSPTMDQWAAAVRRGCDRAGLDPATTVSVEPGRAIVASAAVTLYRAGTIKPIPGVRTYIAVDGGMSDNPRPVLYGSGYEAILARQPFAERPLAARLVGKHCESGDVLLFDARLPADMAVDDIVAMPVTGAYGHSMGSNYNKVLRPAVVFVADGEAQLVIRRETYDDLLLTDEG